MSRREGTTVDKTAGGVTSLGRQLVNSRAPEIAIYLRTYLRAFIAAAYTAYARFSLHPLVLHEQTGCIAATKLVWTAVILNGSEASGPLTNSRAQCIARRCIHISEVKREVRAIPPPSGLILADQRRRLVSNLRARYTVASPKIFCRSSGRLTYNKAFSKLIRDFKCLKWRRED